MRVSDNCLCAKLSTKDPSRLTDNHEFRPMGKNKKQMLEAILEGSENTSLEVQKSGFIDVRTLDQIGQGNLKIDEILFRILA